MRFPLTFSLRFVFGISLAAALFAFVFDKDLGINLLTEVAGVALTVFVINNIIERRERQKRIAIDQRILRELQFIVASYYSIWKHLYWQHAQHEKIETENDLMRIYPLLLTNTDITKNFDTVSLNHPESWELFFYNRSIKDCFANYHSTLTKEIQTFINDFKIYIEPELLDILLSMLEGAYFKDILMMNQDSTATILAEIGMDANRLDSYLKPAAVQHIHQIMALSRYSQTLYTMIREYKKVEIELYQIKKYFTHPSKQFSEFVK